MKAAATSALILVIIVMIMNAGGGGFGVNGQGVTRWCVAKPSASVAELTSNIEYACNNLDNCNMIKPGGSCFLPDTTVNHASVVMNEYFAKNQRTDSTCYFGNTGIVAYSDPSIGNCVYA
ncbi:hypothetical protein P8452_77110 [Trifolium repens]|nr:hypothetical protein P8452_77110 [Trifolium repens]